VNDSGPSSKTGAAPLRRGLGACMDRATGCCNRCKLREISMQGATNSGWRGALISRADEQRRTVKWRAGALSVEALSRRCLNVGFSQARLA